MATTKKAIDGIVFAPRTEHGAGILPLFFRATLRALTLAYVNYMKWPMTLEQAHAEMSDAATAFNRMTLPKDLMSDSTASWINMYGQELQRLADRLDAARKDDPDGSVEPFAESIRSILNSTLAIFSKLDTELFGIKADATDPGSLL